MSDEVAIVLFDGDCNLCNRAVDFILRHDGEGRFRFAPLQSQEAVRACGGASPPGDTLVLIDGEGRHERSAAVLRIAAGLDRPWSWLRFWRIVPRAVRDRLYDALAGQRLRWFGRRESCRVPSPAERERFLVDE